MKNKTILCTLGILTLSAALIWVVLAGIRQPDFELKRQNEKQIILYQDRNDVEVFYYAPENASPEEIRVELCYGDGPIEVARTVVRPGKTITLIKTLDGEPFNHFVPGIYTGRILIFDAKTGQLKDRISKMEIRLYGSYLDDYDSLAAPEETKREVSLLPYEPHQTFLKMSIDLKNEEITPCLQGLRAEWRDIDCRIYAEINGTDMLIAEYNHLPPNSMLYGVYLKPGVASLLAEGETIPVAHVDTYYSDTGEFRESIPGEINRIYRPE